MSRESHKGYELWVRSKGPLQARISSQRIHESERESDKQWCVRQTVAPQHGAWIIEAN